MVDNRPNVTHQKLFVKTMCWRVVDSMFFAEVLVTGILFAVSNLLVKIILLNLNT